LLWPFPVTNWMILLRSSTSLTQPLVSLRLTSQHCSRYEAMKFTCVNYTQVML
jgi:hypothetical protein